MNSDKLEDIVNGIQNCTEWCRDYNFAPLTHAGIESKILVVTQEPSYSAFKEGVMISCSTWFDLLFWLGFSMEDSQIAEAYFCWTQTCNCYFHDRKKLEEARRHCTNTWLLPLMASANPELLITFGKKAADVFNLSLPGCGELTNVKTGTRMKCYSLYHPSPRNFKNYSEKPDMYKDQRQVALALRDDIRQILYG